MEIKAENELGIEYIEAITKVIAIREDRRKIYGDSFLQESMNNILAIIDGKRNRFNVLRNTNPSHPKTEDEIIDIINYYLFLLCLINKRNKEKENEKMQALS